MEKNIKLGLVDRKRWVKLWVPILILVFIFLILVRGETIVDNKEDIGHKWAGSETQTGNNADVNFVIVEDDITHKCIDFNVIYKQQIQPLFTAEVKDKNFGGIENFRLYQVNDVIKTEETKYYKECLKKADIWNNLTEEDEVQEYTGLCYDYSTYEDKSIEELTPIDIGSPITLNKDETKTYRVCFDVPIVQTDGGWGSKGTFALYVNGEEFKDLSHSSWWDTNWGYRQKLSITDNYGVNMTNYSMNVTMDTATLISSSKMQSNCRDIRILEDGNPLSFGIVNCNTASTMLLFKLRDGIEGGTDDDIYVYYGNVGASAGNSSPWQDAYYLWWDHFDTNRRGGWGNDTCIGGNQGSNANTDEATVDTVNSRVYLKHIAYNDAFFCPRDKSWENLPPVETMKWEGRIMTQNDVACQNAIVMVNITSTGTLGAGYAIPRSRGSTNDYTLLFSGQTVWTINASTWYKVEAYWNTINGTWYGTYAGHTQRSGTKAIDQGHNISAYYVDICNNQNLYIDEYAYYFYVEPKPSFSFAGEESFGVANEAEGDAAIELGITTSEIGGTATIYNSQQIAARNLATNQFSGIFDKMAVNGNKRWAFNYVSSGESQITGLFNLTPVLYVLQLADQTNATITDQVGKLINSTYP